ncbi:MAG TPA: sugar ABC transporter permease [Spirochaetia bacterium]|nr:sugar ABC transporter permease [Spirochaetia bacterium]
MSAPRHTAFPGAGGIQPYLFIAPALLVIGLFVLYPVIDLFYLSLCKANILGRTRFLGLDNFAALLTSLDFANSLRATVVFMAVVVVVQTALALVVALLVESESRFMGTLRTIYFLPVVIPFVVASFLWKFIYDPDVGLINSVLQFLHLPRTGFLANPSQALGSLIAACVWKAWAFFTMIFLSGLKEIPRELYECAAIEGARPVQRIRWVTLPLLRRVLLFVIVVTTMDSVARVFTPVFVMTQGGPRGVTDLLVYYDWRTAFRVGDIGFASAVAVFMFLFVLVINLVQLRLGRERDA